MHWPDIFFKARKPRPEFKRPAALQPVPEGVKPAAIQSKPPAIKPVPVALGTQATTVSAPVKKDPEEATTRTLSATHGVVLRPPVWPTLPANTPPDASPPAAPTGPARDSSPVKNIEELMVEADPVRTLTKTGGIHLLKRSAPQPGAPSGPTKAPPAEPAPIKSQPSPPSAASTPPAAPASPSSPPPSQPAAVSVAPEVKKADPPLMPFGSIFHRKAKMTELARIVLPRKREESEPPPAPSESSPTVVPPAFPVAAMTVRASQPAAGAAHSGNNEVSPPEKAPDAAAKTEKTASPETAPASPSAAEAKPAAPLPAVPDAPPKVDPEAHKPEPSATPLPKIDPEAHQTPPAPATALPLAQPTAPSDTPERREFHLANGERVAGIVLSETPEAVYIDHGTLGVLTIPRAQIARRLVEIILINGDRIVGDIMAETADTLYVRHASLGMLTVPRAQRSTRVVEAILKDGDRILGEVLTETDAFTVIRSATLGTITVPHGKISMLNRKIEQIELKALPPSAPEIKDKPTG